MVFYQSFCKKLKDGVCFHADWEGKGALICLIFRHMWTNPPRRTDPRQRTNPPRGTKE